MDAASGRNFCIAGQGVTPPSRDLADRRDRSTNFENPNFLDVRADLVFDLIAHLRIEEGLPKRGVDSDFTVVGGVLALDQGEGESLAIGDALDLNPRAQRHRLMGFMVGQINGEVVFLFKISNLRGESGSP